MSQSVESHLSEAERMAELAKEHASGATGTGVLYAQLANAYAAMALARATVNSQVPGTNPPTSAE